MKPKAVTVGVPVRDLLAATTWYRAAFGLDEPDLQPVEGVVEFDLGTFWLQLSLSPESAGGAGISVTLSVDDATSEHDRLLALGLDVTDVQRIEGVVDLFELTDPDGNTIGFVTELA